MKVYILRVINHEEDESYIEGVYETEQKAVDTLMEIAIGNREPALLLMRDASQFVNIVYHYPDYKGNQYIIEKWHVS